MDGHQVACVVQSQELGALPIPHQAVNYVDRKKNESQVSHNSPSNSNSTLSALVPMIKEKKETEAMETLVPYLVKKCTILEIVRRVRHFNE